MPSEPLIDANGISYVGRAQRVLQLPFILINHTIEAVRLGVCACQWWKLLKWHISVALLPDNQFLLLMPMLRTRDDRSNHHA